MAKKAQDPTTEFEITLKEFLESLGNRQIETSTAFAKQLHADEGKTHRTRGEWSTLLDLFRSKPTSVTWPQWLEKNKGGK